MNFNLEVFNQLWLLCMKNHKQHNEWAIAAGVSLPAISQLKSAYLAGIKGVAPAANTRRHLPVELLAKLSAALIEIGVSRRAVRRVLMAAAREESDQNKKINLMLAISSDDEKTKICDSMGI